MMFIFNSCLINIKEDEVNPPLPSVTTMEGASLLFRKDFSPHPIFVDIGCSYLTNTAHPILVESSASIEGVSSLLIQINREKLA